MEKRIELEKRGKTPEQIKELTLDNCRSTSFVGLTDAFTNLKSLSAINVGLTSLKGFPKLPKLQKLELSDNRISGGLNILASSCPNLVSLKLSGNKIETVETLEPLKELKNLKTLDLFNCNVSTTTNYREKMFSMFPSLKFLDGYDKDEKEAECSDEENDEKHLDGNSDLDEEEEEEEDDDDDLDGELDDEEEEEEDGEIDLKYLEKENIDEESEGEDYSPEEVVDEEEEDEEEDAGEDGNPRGQKRKLDDSQD